MLVVHVYFIYINIYSQKVQHVGSNKTRLSVWIQIEVEKKLGIRSKKPSHFEVLKPGYFDREFINLAGVRPSRYLLFLSSYQLRDLAESAVVSSMNGGTYAQDLQILPILNGEHRGNPNVRQPF